MLTILPLIVQLPCPLPSDFLQSIRKMLPENTLQKCKHTFPTKEHVLVVNEPCFSQQTHIKSRYTGCVFRFRLSLNGFCLP